MSARPVADVPFDRPVLVTGAAGCIGAWVTAKLVELGAEVVCLDLRDDRRRLKLVLDTERADAVPWIVSDITDGGAIARVVADRGVGAIIHLAALQIPFCKEDPVGGARVNVVGQVNVFEAARANAVAQVVYASSVAAVWRDETDQPTTLYGVYKTADEGIARVYAQDWGVRSIGLRPHTVYGPGRDQGLTSAPTKAMLAAAAGKPFTIPFDGALLFQYAGEVAEIIVRCAATPLDGAPVFDLKGARATMAEVAAAVREAVPDARISIEGEALTLPTELDDAPLRAAVGAWPETSFDHGVAASITAFRDLLDRGLVSADGA